MHELLSILFGRGAMILWHLALWLGFALLVAAPLLALSSDATRVPRPIPSLGSFAFVMIIAGFAWFALLASGLIFVRASSLSWLPATGLAFLTATAPTLWLLWLLLVLCERGGHLAVAATWTAAALILLASLAMSRLGAAAEPGSVALSTWWLLALLLVGAGAIVLMVRETGLSQDRAAADAPEGFRTSGAR